MSLPSWSQFAACCADRLPRRAPAPPKHSLNESCGFAVCPDAEVQVNPAPSDLSNSRNRDLKECCSRVLGSLSLAPRRGLTGRFPSAPAGRKLRS